uniref:Protein kinase domain-containing protein n=1 Tax=Aplanochytrium stocchinoi TaxID=215587 RepID=A0A7S3PG33_9STRA
MDVKTDISLELDENSRTSFLSSIRRFSAGPIRDRPTDSTQGPECMPNSPVFADKEKLQSLASFLGKNAQDRLRLSQCSRFGRRRSRSSMGLGKQATTETSLWSDIPGLNAEGEGVKLALSFLEAQDTGVLKSAGECVGRLLQDVGSNPLHEDDSDNATAVCTPQELQALSVLAMSRNVALRQVSGNVIMKITNREGFTRGKLPMSSILKRATEMVNSETQSLQVFAIRMAISLALKGPIWCERIVEQGWLDRMIEIIMVITKDGEWSVESRMKSEDTFDSASSTCSSYGSSTEEGNVEEGKENSSHRCSTPPLEKFDSFDFSELPRRRKASSYILDYGYDYSNELTSVAEHMPRHKKHGLHIHGQAKMVLKLALKLVGALNLVQLERALKQRPQMIELSENINEKRKELIELLSHMCERCSSKNDTSLLMLLCGALNSLLSEFSKSEWTDGLSQLFVEKTLGTLLDTAQEATSEIHEITAVVSRCVATDYAAVEREEDERQFFKGAACDVRTSHMIKKSMHLTSLTCEALKVIRSACESTFVAQSTAECFEEYSVMRILTVLSRSQSPGTKTEVASFLYSLCANISDKHKLLLCDSGIIVRLLRLASPSTVYGAYDSPRGHADESAFTPAIRAITEMAKVEIIGARIILAGGLCPLYSHANSSRSTRAAGREALETLGVNDINDVIGFWTNNRKLKEETETMIHEPKLDNKRPVPFMKSKSCSGIVLQRSQSQDSIRPRAQRIETTLSKWHRAAGSSVLLSLENLAPALPGNELWDKSVILGTGSFSTVYRSLLKTDVLEKRENAKAGELIEEDDEWSTVAVKKLTDGAIADESFLNEIKILSKLSYHPNIAHLHGVICTDDSVLLVSEFAGRHTLAHHLASVNTASPSKLCTSWRSRLQVLYGIAEALKYLQSMSPAILHLDLKSSNILLTETKIGEFVPKLCDFGLAVELKAGHEFLSPANHGTLQWMAPEVMHDEEFELSRGFSESADVFSFAILMWEVAHPGRVPWDELSVDANLESIQERIRDIVCSGRRLTCENTHVWPVGFESLMRKCWRQRPTERPCFVRSFLADPDSLGWADGNTERRNSDSIPATLKNMLNHQVDEPRNKMKMADPRKRRNSRPGIMRAATEGPNQTHDDWSPDKSRLLRTFSHRNWNLVA